MEPQFYERDDKQTRSVFVGNIPYDATEDDLKNLFSKIGRVLSFRMVFDRETGKAKGYGFCEFPDLETANSAIRNLNGVEFKNRHLRVDCASIEKAREEPRAEEPFASKIVCAPDVSSKEAPELIRNIMATLPSDKIVELLKQIKSCLQDSPDETREMLIQNPQLSYAILQALLIMNLVDPQSAKAAVLDKRPVYPSRIQTFFPSDGTHMLEMNDDPGNAGHFAPFGPVGSPPMLHPPPVHMHPMQHVPLEGLPFDPTVGMPIAENYFQLNPQVVHQSGIYGGDFNWMGGLPPASISHMHEYREPQEFDPRPVKRSAGRFDVSDKDLGMQSYQSKVPRNSRSEENINADANVGVDDYNGNGSFRYRGDKFSGQRGRGTFRHDPRRPRF